MAISPRRSCSRSACSVPSFSRTEPIDEPSKLLRRSAMARILGDRRDMLVVTGLGSPTYDCAAVGDHPLNFYLWGAMGSAVTVGLGLALAQPKRRVVAIYNEHYGATGLQQTPTSAGVDLARIALRCGLPQRVAVSRHGALDNAAPT